MYLVDPVVSSQCKLGEGPVWHPREEALYWLDILQGNLHRYAYASKIHEVIDLGIVASAMGLRENGGFIMATLRGFAFWDASSAQFEFLGDPEPGQHPDIRFNDGKTDRQNRFWAGKMSGRYENSLFRFDPDRSITRMESGIAVSNGLGWSPDNRVFYFTDSVAKKIYAYDFDPSTGAISNRRDFISVPEAPEEGMPDGLAVDSEGCIWSARWGGWKIVQYDPKGQMMREIRMPVEYPTSCTLGGPNFDELFVTSAWVEYSAEQRLQQSQAGDVFRIQVDTPGLPESFFASSPL